MSHVISIRRTGNSDKEYFIKLDDKLYTTYNINNAVRFNLRYYRLNNPILVLETLKQLFPSIYEITIEEVN